MFHEGQFEGRKVRLPVFLGRRPAEPVDNGLVAFYRMLLGAINSPVFREGEWTLCERTGWPDNPSYQNIVAWHWNYNSERYLIVVNLSDRQAQAMIHTGWDDLADRSINFSDQLSGAKYDRPGDEIQSYGLYVDLTPLGCHFFRFTV